MHVDLLFTNRVRLEFGRNIGADCLAANVLLVVLERVIMHLLSEVRVGTGTMQRALGH